MDKIKRLLTPMLLFILLILTWSNNIFYLWIKIVLSILYGIMYIYYDHIEHK